MTGNEKRHYYLRDANGQTLCELRTENQGHKAKARNIETIKNAIELLEMFDKTGAFGSSIEESRFSITMQSMREQLAYWENVSIVTEVSFQAAGIGKYTHVIVFPDRPGYLRYATSEVSAETRIFEEKRHLSKSIRERPKDKIYRTLLKSWEGAKVMSREDYERSLEGEKVSK